MPIPEKNGLNSVRREFIMSKTYVSMNNHNIVKFKPMFDGLTWSLIAFVLIVCLWPLFLDASWLMVLFLLLCAALCLIPFFSIRYEIDGDELVVYAFWRPSRFPIAKIKEIKPTKSLLSAPATSLTKRIAIYFTDKKVMKSTLPLIISPANQEIFFETLQSINPDIVIEK